ncbi:hypothetical protein PInf_004356 [Phytophthora infestans]|nr:hypothetical protein PInf_004356 [Phytophthora infestans]
MTTPEMNKERLNVQQRIGDCVKSRASGQGAAEAPERGAVVMATQLKDGWSGGQGGSEEGGCYHGRGRVMATLETNEERDKMLKPVDR